MIRFLFAIAILFSFARCTSQELEVGAGQFSEYLPLLENQRVALVVNQTSVVNNSHLVDTLVHLGVNITKVMAPEHGFRGKAPDGEKIDNSVDSKTGIPIVSIYGRTKKPSPEMLSNVDVLIFDIQDVGVRFYTFISTMHYVMEAAAENGKKVIILDRPNPNGMYVDGPVKNEDISGFVAMHPIPIVHGLTVGELAKMINNEGWLKDGATCDLTIVKMKGWDHNQHYSLPIKPSPNLPNDNAISWYPTLGLFEGTVVSVGRGTKTPFEVIGHPHYSKGKITFTPEPNEGSKYPPLEGLLCQGQSFEALEAPKEISLKYLLEYFNDLKDDTTFFRSYIDLLSGTKDFRNQVESGMNEEEIKATWQPSLDKFRSLRKRYLLYPDFE